MVKRAALVSQLRANLTHGLSLRNARRVLHSLQDKILVPNGLYLNGGLAHFGDGSNLSPEISGRLTRADGSDISERDRTRVEVWLAANARVTEFSMGPLTREDSPELLPMGSEKGR